MNGPQDLGGAQGFGPLPIEADEPLFHADWERRALALTLAMGATGRWNIDRSRFMRESLEPARYLAASYYEIWFEGLLRLLADRGLLSPAERAAVDRGDLEVCRGAAGGCQPSAPDRTTKTAVAVGGGVRATPATGEAENPRGPTTRVLRAEEVAAMLARGSPTLREGPPGRFAVGERVRVRLANPIGHTRAPRYVRGRQGRITALHGWHVFPDSNAHDLGEAPQPLYTVRFEAGDLWGADSTAGGVSVDCWESYLEPCPESDHQT